VNAAHVVSVVYRIFQKALKEVRDRQVDLWDRRLPVESPEGCRVTLVGGLRTWEG
jgi:hypothetical protein